MNQPLNQQNMLARDRQLVAEEDFKDRGFALGALTVTGLDESTNYRHLHGTHHISHKEKTVFQNAQRDHRFAAIVVRDLATQFPDSFLNLIGRDYLSQSRMYWRIHRSHNPKWCLRLL